MRLILLFFLLVPSLLMADEEFSGYTEPLSSLELAFPEQGIISKLLVKEGDEVKVGQTLASLDNRVLEADLNVAKEQYALRLDRYKKIKSLHDSKKASTDELNRAKADLAIQKYTFDRIQALIARRTLVSTVDGIVTETFKEASEGVGGVDTPVLSLVQVNQLILNIYVDFQVAQSLKVGRTLPVIFQNGKSLAQGRITFISPDADKASRTVRVKILIDNEDLNYSSGILGKVIIKE